MAKTKKKRSSFSLFRKFLKNREYKTILSRSKTSNKKKNNSKHRATVIRNRILLLSALIALVICTTYVVLLFSHPVGVFEYFGHIIHTSGNLNGYDIELEGGVAESVISEKNIYYLLTDRTLNCYTDTGKTVFEKQHSYKAPIVCSSETRHLIYGQGESGLSVGTVNEVLYTENLEYDIVCADISDAGYYAVATRADGYEASVSVFDKRNKKVFEWFSSEELVNSVSLSPNGKTLAVATVKVKNGSAVSSVHILNYKSATPVMTRSYDDKVVYDIRSISNSVFCTVFSDSIEFLNFKKQSAKVHESEYTVSMVKQFGKRTIAIRTVAANHDESLVEVYNAKGKLIKSFKANTFVSDFSYKSGKLYLLGRNEIVKFDLKGKKLSSCEVGYDAAFLQVISDNKVACINNGSIVKCDLKKTEG